MDETYVGVSKVGGPPGRGSEGKEIVVIAVEVHSPKGFGRVRMRRVPDVSGSSLCLSFVTLPKKGLQF